MLRAVALALRAPLRPSEGSETFCLKGAASPSSKEGTTPFSNSFTRSDDLAEIVHERFDTYIESKQFVAWPVPTLRRYPIDDFVGIHDVARLAVNELEKGVVP